MTPKSEDDITGWACPRQPDRNNPSPGYPRTRERQKKKKKKKGSSSSASLHVVDGCTGIFLHSGDDPRGRERETAGEKVRRGEDISPHTKTQRSSGLYSFRLYVKKNKGKGRQDGVRFIKSTGSHRQG